MSHSNNFRYALLASFIIKFLCLHYRALSVCTLFYAYSFHLTFLLTSYYLLSSKHTAIILLQTANKRLGISKADTGDQFLEKIHFNFQLKVSHTFYTRPTDRPQTFNIFNLNLFYTKSFASILRIIKIFYKTLL